MLAKMAAVFDADLGPILLATALAALFVVGAKVVTDALDLAHGEETLGRGDEYD